VLPEKDKAYIVWDPLVRIFHWTLLVFFLIAYFLEGEWRGLHSHAGYTVTLLVVFRIIWGFMGDGHARFSDFVTGPRITIAYLGQMIRNQAKSHMGHNPAGAAMILMLLSCLVITAISGISLFGMEGSGPFSYNLFDDYVAALPDPLLEEVHTFFADLVAVMIVIHVVGVCVTSLQHRVNLTRAMFTGRK